MKQTCKNCGCKVYEMKVQLDEQDITIPDEKTEFMKVVEQSKQLKCQCEKAQFTRTVDADFNPLCGRCGKAL